MQKLEYLGDDLLLDGPMHTDLSKTREVDGEDSYSKDQPSPPPSKKLIFTTPNN